MAWCDLAFSIIWAIMAGAIMIQSGDLPSALGCLIMSHLNIQDFGHRVRGK